MKLIILITADMEKGLEVALRWQEAGAPGVTLLKSFGLHSLQTKIASDALEVPLHIASSMTSLMAYVLREMEHTNHVLLSVAPAEMISTLAGRGARGHGRFDRAESRRGFHRAAG